MSDLSKRVNKFFNFTPKDKVDEVKSNIIISNHLATVLKMYYEEGYEIDFIAHYLCCSRGKIEADLRKIRKKIEPLI